MSCLVSYIVSDVPTKVVRRGTEPAKPTDWKASAWFVLPSGEKHTHSTVIRGETVHSLVPVMGLLIDTLISDHGDQVTSAGWTAMTHGRKKR